MIIKINEFKIYLEKSVKKEDRVDIYRDNDYIVVRPLTHEASCKYGNNSGSGSGWCISVPSDSSAWDSSPDAIVIFIIQRNYKITKERQKSVDELVELNVLIQSGDASEDDEEKYNFLLLGGEAFDLSKIALTCNPESHKITIWDMNNIDITEAYFYGYKDLPISDSVIDAIDNYLSW